MSYIKYAFAAVAARQAYAQSAIPVGSSPVLQGNTVTVSVAANSPAPGIVTSLPAAFNRGVTTTCPPNIIGCGQNVTEYISDHQETIYVTKNNTLTVPLTVTETNLIVEVSVSTQYTATEGVCSTSIHIPHPGPKIITVEQNVTSTQWWLDRTTKKTSTFLVVNATSTDPCIISSTSARISPSPPTGFPAPSGSATALEQPSGTPVPESRAEEQAPSDEDREDDDEDNRVHMDI